MVLEWAKELVMYLKLLTVLYVKSSANQMFLVKGGGRLDFKE
jgi:hypothetical protein